MKPICAICEKAIVMVEAKTMPSGVVQGLYYPEARLVWTPNQSTMISQDGTGIDWEFLHANCVKTVQSASRPTRI
jgi:hypothetical protein